MDKKDLKPFKVTVTFNNSFADYYDEAVEQLKGEGFLDARNPHKASVLPLWEGWNLAHEDDGTWVFVATVYGISEDDARIATNVAYPSVDCAALRHLVRTEIEAISEPVNSVANTVKHAFLFIFDKETASHFFSSEEYGRDLQNWLLNSDFLSDYKLRESRSCCKYQGDYHIAVSERSVELYIIPKWEDIYGKVPLAQAHQFLASTIEYNDEVMLRNSLVSVEAMELIHPALTKRLDSKIENVNDGEFVRVVIDGEPATYSYKFEVEQRFVLDHEDELGLSKSEARWWCNHSVNDATIADWQMWEALLIHTIRESKAFADLIK
jgi:hypothetical protein